MLLAIEVVAFPHYYSDINFYCHFPFPIGPLELMSSAQLYFSLPLWRYPIPSPPLSYLSCPYPIKLNAMELHDGPLSSSS